MTIDAKIIKTLTDTKRHGIDNLCKWLNHTDFFSAPASTKHHLAEEGGLAQHSWNVYEELKLTAKRICPDVDPSSIAIVGLLHDVCKVHFYRRLGSSWIVDDQLPLGHGEKSLALIAEHIHLTKEEALAIRWHMGPWDTSDFKTLNQAMDKAPLLKAVMLADQMAAWTEE